MKPPKRTLLDSEPPLSRAERADAAIAWLKQRDEALFDAVVAWMEQDEDFRRRVHAEAERIGVGRRGGKAQNQDLVRSIVHDYGGSSKQEIIGSLMKTLGVSAKQAGRLYDDVRASDPTIRTYGRRK